MGWGNDVQDHGEATLKLGPWTSGEAKRHQLFVGRTKLVDHGTIAPLELLKGEDPAFR